MLNNDLTVTDNGTGTKPGSAGALVYALRSTEATGSVRSVAAVSTTTPKLMTIGHQMSGAGFKQRVRTMVKWSYQKLDSDLAVTGGVIPECQVLLTINRPINSGGFITSAIVKEGIGAVLDAIMASGQLDKLLNQEY
jgi:hypothetical protein